MYENSVTYQFVGNVVSGLANGAAVTGIAEGGVAVVTEAGTAVNPNALVGAAVPIKIATRVNGVLKFSPVFTRGNARITDLAYVAPVEQVSFIGWNGTAGALDTEIDATYVASVRLENTQGVYNNTPIIKTVPVYLPDNVDFAGTTLGQFEHATRLMDSFIAQFSEARLGGQVIRAERTNSGARTALGTAVGDVVFTNGSTVISADDIDDATGAGTVLTVGELLVVGTAANSPVYRIESIDVGANTAVLDRPYQGPTATIDDADLRAITVANQADTDYGIRLTGVTPAQFDAKTDMFPRRVRFQASYTKTFTDPFNLFRKITEPADAAFTTTVAANEGLGSPAEVAKREVYTNMNEQNHIVSHFPPTTYRDSVIAGNTYRQIVINSVHDAFVDVAVGKRPISRFNIVIALENATVQWNNLNTVLGF